MVIDEKIRQIGNLAEKEGGRRNPSCGRVIYHRRITQIGRKFILGLF